MIESLICRGFYETRYENFQDKFSKSCKNSQITVNKRLGFMHMLHLTSIDELQENLKNGLNPIVFLRFSETTNYSHAVVVYKISKEKVFVLDPEIGEREFDINLFVENWSRGLTIIIEKKTL